MIITLLLIIKCHIKDVHPNFNKIFTSSNVPQNYKTFYNLISNN